VRVKHIVLSVVLPVVQKLHCSARCAVEFALICEFGSYYEVVGIILQGSRSEFATLIGVGPGLCGLPRILFPRRSCMRARRDVHTKMEELPPCTLLTEGADPSVQLHRA
jgi:hypothetical protein